MRVLLAVSTNFTDNPRNFMSWIYKYLFVQLLNYPLLYPSPSYLGFAP